VIAAAEPIPLPAVSLGRVDLPAFAVIVPATLPIPGWHVRAAHAVNAGKLRRLFALFALFAAPASARLFRHRPG
jgi:hypothetical protein